MQPSSPGCRWEAHGIFSLPLYDQAACSAILQGAREVGFWSAAAVGREDAARVDHDVRVAYNLDPCRGAALHRRFERAVLRAVVPLLQKEWGCQLAACEGTQLIRYIAGGHYIPHSDADDGEYASRYFTVLCYLNENFTGGKTCFPSLGYSAQPAAGRAIVFPSRFLHSAEPVLAGEKLVFLTWITGPAPVRWI